jgi:hypothetical protein
MIEIIEKPNIDVDRTSTTPGSPISETVSGYVTWSSTSCGERPGQSVKTICWFSPRSGMASTAIGLRGRMSSDQSNGATDDAPAD